MSALPPGTPFVTVEVDGERAAAAKAIFAGDSDVRVLTGDWRELLPGEAPFDFVFVDGGDARGDVEAVLSLLAPRGTVVMDDFWFDPNEPDRRRDSWLEHPELSATELWVTPERRAVIAVRRG